MAPHNRSWFTVALTVLATAGCVRSATPTPTLQPSATPLRSTPTPIATASPTASTADLRFQPDIVLAPANQIGRDPGSLAVLGRRLYVANRETDNVSVMEQGRVIRVISVGDAPTALAADEQLGRLYVANEGDHTLSILSEDGVVATVQTARNPVCLAVASGRVFVGGRGSNDLTVHDARSGAKTATATVPGSVGVLALAVNPALRLLYASTYGTVQILGLDNLSVVGVVQLDVYVTLGSDPATGRLFCAEYDSLTNKQYLVAFDALGQKELGRAPVGGDPRGMAVDSERGRVYVANSFSNDLSVIDAQSLQPVATVPVGLRPLAVTVDRDNTVYVACSDAHAVAIVDGKTVALVRSVPVCPAPAGMVVDHTSGRLYVAVPGANSVWVIDGASAKVFSAGLHPAEVALSTDGTKLFVLNHVGGDLMVVNAQDGRELGRTQVGDLPQGIVVAPTGGRVVVSDMVLDAGGQEQLHALQVLSAYGDRPVKPAQVLVDGSRGLVFAIAPNGVAGSNSGMVVYVLDLATGKRLEKSLGGISTTAIALDEEGQRLYSVASRMPVHRLFVDDVGSFSRVASIALPEYPAALAYNPTTHHLFICLSPVLGVSTDAVPELLVLDTRSLGTVVRLRLPAASAMLHRYSLAVDRVRNLIYVGDAQLGCVHVLRDVVLPPPPAPSPAPTPSPWPTLTPRP